MTPGYRTPYDVMDALRLRPAMFLHNSYKAHPFAALMAFESGLSWSDLEPGEPPFWEFSRWITQVVDGISGNLPWDWLLERLGSEGAFEAYFQHLNVYRQCRLTEVLRTSVQQLEVRSYTFDASGTQVPVEKPERLFVGQFTPSVVFFLGEVYGGRLEKRFPYHRSAEEAIRSAEFYWGVPPLMWGAV